MMIGILIMAGFPFGQWIASDSYRPVQIALDEPERVDSSAQSEFEKKSPPLSPPLVCDSTDERLFPLFTVAQSNPSYPLSKATDGDASTAWYGRISEPFPKLLTMNLKDRYCVRSFSLIIPASDLPLTFSLETSLDGTTWEEIVHEQTLLTERTLDIQLPLYVEAQYMRLIELSAARPFGALAEWSVRVGKPVS